MVFLYICEIDLIAKIFDKLNHNISHFIVTGMLESR